MNSGVLEKYIEEYGKDIYSFCVYTTRNKETAEDLYQQTFLVAFEKDEIDETRNPKSYLIAIAVNLWNNQKRKYLWRNKKANIVNYEEENLEQLADDGANVEEQIVRKDEIIAVRKLVDELPEKMRMVILMYYMEDMTIDEIGFALKIPFGTVKSRLHQAKARLKEGMMKYEG